MVFATILWKDQQRSATFWVSRKKACNFWIKVICCAFTEVCRFQKFAIFAKKRAESAKFYFWMKTVLIPIKVIYCASDNAHMSPRLRFLVDLRIQPFLQKSAKTSQILSFVQKYCHFQIKVIYCASDKVHMSHRLRFLVDLKIQPFLQKSAKISQILSSVQKYCHFWIKVICSAPDKVHTNIMPRFFLNLKIKPYFCKNGWNFRWKLPNQWVYHTFLWSG